MQKSSLVILTLLLLSGCTDLSEEPGKPPEKPPVSKAEESDAAATEVVASVLLASTLAKAKESDKRVLVHLGAPWCGWCKVFEEFLETNAALFADDYLVLKIDVEEMVHGDVVEQQLRSADSEGIPWFAILDGNGTPLITSDGPNGNIGCPLGDEERAYFVSMIDQTIQHAPDGQVKKIATALDAFAQKKR